jgi:hypothetical protein
MVADLDWQTARFSVQAVLAGASGLTQPAVAHFEAGGTVPRVEPADVQPT